MPFNVGRLTLDAPLTFAEQLGDPITNQGGAAVPAPRQGLKATVGVDTFSTVDTLADRQRVRRQLRSMFNNTLYKLQGFYLVWDEDGEQNGWYLPDQGQLTDIAEPSGVATGAWQLAGVGWQLAGHPRTHRRAVQVYMKDVRLSTTPRDFYRTIYSTDFSGLTALQLTFLPGDVTDPVNAVTGTPVAALALPRVSWDGGQDYQVLAQPDLTVLSVDQPDVSRNRGDVVLYDRRGSITAGATAVPDPLWEEVYGSDYPLLQPTTDAPVLQNGQVRVRYDSTNSPGFRIDIWTGAAWAEQGKVNFYRRIPAGTVDDTLVQASVLEYTPHRAVVQIVMRSSTSGDASRERIVITLQRGWDGPRFEVYPAARTDGSKADASIIYSPAAVDVNDSAVKIDAAGAGTIVATAGSGSALLPGVDLGAATFTGENTATLLRQGGAFVVTLAALQAAATATIGPNNAAYGGANRNVLGFYGNGAQLGYLSAQLGYCAQLSDQIMEAESMTLGVGTTSVADVAASAGNTAQATRTADAIHVSRANWPNAATGKYRVFARVKTSASTLNVYAKSSVTTGATKTTTSATYVWLDLGDISSAGAILEIHAWATAAATFAVDRIEAIKLEDRTATVPTYDGARDTGQAVLMDSRSQQTVVTR